MTTSARFAVAVHIMAMLAANRDRAVTSDELARSAGTNPVVVRRLMIDLAAVGLTRSQLGKGGGARLSRGPKRISLSDIFCAVENKSLVAMPRSAPDPTCLVGGSIGKVVSGMAAEAEAAFFKTLEAKSLRDVVKALKSLQ